MDLKKYPFKEETNFGMLTRLIEECSEAIQIACKCQRFGFNKRYPDGSKNNLEKLASEMIDIKLCIKEIEKRMLL